VTVTAWSPLEQRIGRQLTAAEHHIAVEQIDELLNQAKDLLDAEIRREQARLATHIAETGGGGRMNVTPRMLALVRGLQAHGRAHAANELHSMGYPVKAQTARALAADLLRAAQKDRAAPLRSTSGRCRDADRGMPTRARGM
jgi:hypothetical protein